MIVYQPAFDLYHTVYRMLRILSFFKRADSIEIERLRIWDFYLLYPNKMSKIRLKKEEADIKEMIKTYILREENIYETIKNERIMFEKIRPYQMTAIKCLASYGLINKDYLNLNRITSISHEKLKPYLDKFESLEINEENAIKLLTSHFFLMPLYGLDGLKQKTNLLESKYDAQ